VLLVKSDAVALHQGDEVGAAVACQRGAAIGGIFGYEIGRAHVAVGEIAAPAARDPDLLAHLERVVDQQDAPPALAGDAGAE
jgi:hypothetical protein